MKLEIKRDTVVYHSSAEYTRKQYHDGSFTWAYGDGSTQPLPEQITNAKFLITLEEEYQKILKDLQ